MNIGGIIAILSSHVINEVRAAFNKNLVIISFRIDNIQPSTELGYFIGTFYWLNALTPPIEKQIEELLDIIQVILNIKRKLLTEPPDYRLPRGRNYPKKRCNSCFSPE
jgi:hypothetical protein